MSSIKSVTDLRNYDEILRDVAEGAPVFLTEGDRSRYVLLAMSDYERINATTQFFSALEKGEESAKKEGWIDSASARKMLGI